LVEIATVCCVAPWPSGLYQVDDASTATGVRLSIPEGALPTNIDNTVFDPAVFNNLDGFSSAAPMIIAFPGGILAQGPERTDHEDQQQPRLARDPERRRHAGDGQPAVRAGQRAERARAIELPHGRQVEEIDPRPDLGQGGEKR
jgi:hypothetical protein